MTRSADPARASIASTDEIRAAFPRSSGFIVVIALLISTGREERKSRLPWSRPWRII